MAEFIITSCNTGRYLSMFGVVIFNAETQRFRIVNMAQDKSIFREITGFTGMLRYKDKYYLAGQGHPSSILVLDVNLNLIEYVRLSKYYDIHSLDMHDGKLYFAATSENQIIEININDYSETVVWDAGETEALHLNTVKYIDDRMLILMHHGLKQSSKKKKGMLVDALTKDVLLDDLSSPHNIHVSDAGDVTILDSATSRAFTAKSGNWVFSISGAFEGYLRGVGEDSEYRVFGISAGRVISRKQGPNKKYFTGSFMEYFSAKAFQSYIILDNKYSSPDESKYISFIAYGREVYEILPLFPDSKPAYMKNWIANRELVYGWLKQRDRPDQVTL